VTSISSHTDCTSRQTSHRSYFNCFTYHILSQVICSAGKDCAGCFRGDVSWRKSRPSWSYNQIDFFSMSLKNSRFYLVCIIWDDLLSLLSELAVSVFLHDTLDHRWSAQVFISSSWCSITDRKCIDRDLLLRFWSLLNWLSLYLSLNLVFLVTMVATRLLGECLNRLFFHNLADLIFRFLNNWSI
jgi:hypothetical protein